MPNKEATCKMRPDQTKSLFKIAALNTKNISRTYFLGQISLSELNFYKYLLNLSDLNLE